MEDITYSVEEPVEERNRLTVAFRIILAIPHLLLVGGPGFGWGIGTDRTGALGFAALMGAIINWFAIVFTGKAVKGLLDLQVIYLRWRANALAYMALLRDEYPPFMDGPYPVLATFPAIEGERHRWSVGLRPLLVLPHVIVYVFILLAWVITAIVGWFAVLITGRYPASFWRFGEGVLRWGLRIEAYALLMHDTFPPFGLAAEAPRPRGSTAEATS